MPSFIEKNAFRLVRLVAAVALAASVAGCDINKIPTYQQQAHASWDKVHQAYSTRLDLAKDLITLLRPLRRRHASTYRSVQNSYRTTADIMQAGHLLTDQTHVRRFQAAQNNLGEDLRDLIDAGKKYASIRNNKKFQFLTRALKNSSIEISDKQRDFVMRAKRYNAQLRSSHGRVWRALLFPGYTALSNLSFDDALARTLQDQKIVSK